MANLIGQGPVGAPHPTSEVATTPYPLAVGAVARDSAGNVYVYCDFTGSVFGGTPVQISSSFTAEKIGITGRGAFGVACGAATSDNAGWVQVYGEATVQLLGATAGVSPSDAANGPTTLSTTAQTKFWLPTTATSTGPEGVRWTSGSTSTTSGFYIDGMTVSTNADLTAVSAVTAATSHTGEQVKVFLNFPKIVHVNYGE
jgi:hypothetical protein